MTVASTAPVEISMWYISRTTSATWRRESRNTPASVAMCASSFGPNAEPDTPAGSRAN
jgi:hypothetical protein